MAMIRVRIPRISAQFVAMLAVALFGKPAVSLSQQARKEPPNRLAPNVLAEFDVQKDGGPLVIPVVMEPPRGHDNGPPLNLKMLVDTGASHTLFHTSCCSASGRRKGEVEANVLSGTAQVETYAPPRLRIGPLLVRPKLSQVACMDLTACRDGFGEPIDGLLGTDVLSQLVFQSTSMKANCGCTAQWTRRTDGQCALF